MAEEDVPERIPVVEERVRVARRVEKTATVTVTTAVERHHQQVEAPVRISEVVVERHPVGRWVDGPMAPRQEGETSIFPVVEEVPEVVTRYRLVEEVHVRPQLRVEPRVHEIELARGKVSVDRIPNDSRQEEGQ